MRIKKNKRFGVFNPAFIVIFAVLLFAANIDCVAERDSKSAAVVENEKNEPETSSRAVMDMKETGKAFTDVSKKVLPSVVSIATTKVIERSNSGEELLAPLLKEFFGEEFQFNLPEEQRLQGLGSGVIVSKKGHIITNHHVIANADDIKVTLYDYREFDAELVGTDPLTEIAVIKIDAEELPVAEMGDSENLEIGEWVLALGNPLYLTSTVTAGIVSAKGRSIGIIRDTETQSGGSYAIENFIQTDAAINPGNSGGALVNLDAQLMGINTAIASRTGGYQGYGFAVPSNLANKIKDDLIRQGYVTRAWLGISMGPVTENVAERFDMDRPKGVIINQIMEDSPAETAGLAALDIILEIDGKKINRTNKVQNIVALKDPGDTISMTLLRDGKKITKKAELGQRKKQDRRTRKSGPEKKDAVRKLGLTVENLTRDIQARLRHDHYEPGEGVIVTDVKRFSAAYEAGLGTGDYILEIEYNDIGSVTEFKKELEKHVRGDVMIFSFQRGESKSHAFVKMPKEE